ncbi:putative sugar transporter [Flavihumibacter petaseus NBRC 106054]|uniref:Putative sugar transporter n=2 Tax=Flavihumibacter TaxID=1004301 RepID=A0A0E9N0P4_9BACT|nr:putative sugar transporter [Flavihumibacter petaseus NBRC 106054]
MTAALGGLLFGFDTAVISGALQMIKGQFSLNTVMEGWLVSSGLLGCIIGVLITGILSDRIGRKKTILLAAFMFLVSAIGCSFPSSVSQLIFFRLIGGVGVGMASVISPMLIAEFAMPESRGRMIAYYQLAITAGILAAYFSNVIISGLPQGATDSNTIAALLVQEKWRTMFLVMAIPSILFLLLLFRVPESPRWLITRGKREQASVILHDLRPAEQAAKELDAITTAASRQSTQQRSWKDPAIRLPLIIGIVLAVFQQFSGINAIIYYGPKIFASANAGNENAMVFQSILGAVNVLFTIVAIKTADRYGRKALLKWGLTGIVFSLFTCGFLFYTGYTPPVLVLTLILIFIACFAFSLGPVTWIIINEMFPTDVRVKAVSICTMFLWIANWIVGQFFPWLLESVGAGITFWIFAVCSLINYFFSINIVKETSGKSLEEMENVFVAPH